MATRDDIVAFIDERIGGIDSLEQAPMLADGLEDAFIGISQAAFGEPVRAVYSANKVVAKFIREGMSGEEAWEFYDFNVLGAYVGETTPLFVEEFGQGG